MELAGLSFDLADLATEARRPEPSELYDLLVLGGGPAAMTAVVYAARQFVKLAMITQAFGGQMAETSEIENYMGFQTVTGVELTQKFKEQVRQFDVPIAFGEKVTGVKHADGIFTVQTNQGPTCRGRAVIVATGKRYRQLGVPGEKELTGHGVAYCSICDAPLFKDKTVAIVGGGNSAFTAAIDLLKSAREVTMFNYAAGWQGDAVLRRTVEKSGGRVKLLDRHEILAIEGEKRVQSIRFKDRRTGEELSLPVDGVFVEIGLIPNSEPIVGLAELNDKQEMVVDCATRTSVPGLFGAGDVTTVPYKQIVISAGEGAKAALAAHDYLVNQGLL
jgi:alkyl hydroperoxide reductase subunit F